MSSAQLAIYLIECNAVKLNHRKKVNPFLSLRNESYVDQNPLEYHAVCTVRVNLHEFFKLSLCCLMSLAHPV